MNKQMLIDTIAEKTEMTKKDIATVIDTFQDVVKDTMIDGGEIVLTGFAKFYVTDVAERQGRNPKSGESITIPAHKAVKVRVGKGLKESIK